MEIEMTDMNPQTAEAILREIMKQFSEFATNLATKAFPIFAPPFRAYADHKGDIISFLQKMFEEYKKKVKEINCLDKADFNMHYLANSYQVEHGGGHVMVEFDILRDIDLLCRAIIRALNAYFSGFPAKAYEEMEKVFTDNNLHLLMLLPQIVCEKGNMHFYRLRGGTRDKAKDLFHVPFEMRHKTSNYRFSINGTPSLYCAETLKTCVMENRIAVGSEISVADFIFPAEKGIKVIDLTLPGSRPLTFWEEYSLVLFYPLIMACGLKVREENAQFKQEYVIPQLFYQVMRMHAGRIAEEIRGIAYVSTRYANPDFTDRKMRNYALFVYHCNNESGYDKELADLMKIIGPVSVQYDSETDLDLARKMLNAKTPQEITL